MLTETREHLTAFLDEVQPRLSPTTWRDYRARLLKVAGDAGDWKEIGRKIVEISVSTSPKNFNNYLAAWRSFARWARTRATAGGVLEELTSWILDLPFRKAPLNPPRAYSPQEFQAVISRLDEETADWAIVLVSTGIRLTEAVKLTWADIDLCEGWAVIRGTKTALAARTIAVPRPGIAALLRQRARTPADEKRAFPRSLFVLRMRWRKAHPRRVPYRPPRTLRHTFTTWALQAGENVLWVQHQLGHRDLTMISRRYGQLLTERGAEKLAALVFETTQVSPQGEAREKRSWGK